MSVTRGRDDSHAATDAVALWAGTGLWAWLLGYPFYGPLLAAAAPQNPTLAGYAFVLGHIPGLALAHRLGLLRLASGWGACLAAFALGLAPLLPLPRAAAPVAFAAAGLLAAGGVRAWVAAVNTAHRPARAFLVPAVLGNLVLWALPFLRPAPAPADVAALTLASALLVGVGMARHPASSAPTTPAGERQPAARAARGLIFLFAAAAYVGGGVLYRALAPAALALPALRAAGVGPYLAALAVGTRLAFAPHPSPQGMVPWILASLGCGYVLLSSLTVFPGLIAPAWLLVQAGLGAADAYLWRWAVAWERAGDRAGVGLLLGWNVAVIALAGLLFDAVGWVVAGPARLPAVGIAAALVLLALLPPLVARLPVLPPTTRNADTTLAPVQPEAPRLTPTERRVLDLLLAGRTDAEIAAELVITRHTVKYHVRNVLRKVGCRNRRELRERFTPAAPAAAALPSREGVPPPR